MEIINHESKDVWTPEQRKRRLIGVTAALVIGVLELLAIVVYQSFSGQAVVAGGLYGTAVMIPVWIAVMSLAFAYVVKRGAPDQNQERMMKASILLLFFLMASGAGLAVFLGM